MTVRSFRSSLHAVALLSVASLALSGCGLVSRAITIGASRPRALGPPS